MKVIVNRKALDEAIQKIIIEKSTHSARIDTIALDDAQVDSDAEQPIQPTEIMSNPLSVDRPPVEQEAFVPASTRELSMSAAVIAEEVPDSQIEFFYRKLHDLLDQTLDNEAEDQGEQKISESFKRLISLISEQAELDDDDDGEDVSDEDADRILSSIPEGVDKLVEDIFEFRQKKIEEWINSGMMSDARRTLESQYPYIFEKPTNISDLVLGILELPSFSSDVESLSSSMNVSQDAIKLSALRKFKSAFPYLQDQESSSYTMSPEQIEVNQKLAKELDEFLPEMTYQDIIKLYEERLMNKSLSMKEPLLAQGYKDMIAIVKGRISDPRKRERTDLSAKIAKENQPQISDDEIGIESQSEEERLKALDALAPYFGFKNASGIRQWRRKYAEPKFKALLGAQHGMKAYDGYGDRVADNMAALLDKFNDIASSTLENLDNHIQKNPDDTETTELRDSFKHIADQIFSMHEESLDSETGLPSEDSLLNTAAGMMLRIGFAELYFNNQFRDYAKEMKDNMVIFLTGLGVDTSTSKTFAKMFNGEVDLVSLDDDKAQARKLVKGGITQEIWNKSVKESERLTQEFFIGERQKAADKKYLDALNTKNKIAAIFEKSIDMTLDSLEMEEKIDKASKPRSEEEQEELQERFRRIVSRMKF